jgi:spermidine/putrescine ABC transporter ATP-binding subunit
LLGPSGSGKTTTLMMLAGVEIPTAGEIYVANEPVAETPPFRRNIGMVFQSYALFPHMTVGQNIAFPLELRKLSKGEIARRTREVLALVNLEGYQDRYPRQLSGGQQQRIALARALVFNPSVLLMDEPLGALDKQLREHLQLEIKALHEQLGVTIIYVTHDQQEALVMSDRVAVMNHGRLEQVGTPTELYDAPASRFVASFIGDSNFLEGRVVGQRNGYCDVEVAGAGVVRAPAVTCSPGAEVALAIRPEKITLAGETDGAGVNTVTATIEDEIFTGEARRYRARLGDGQSLVLKRQNRSGIPPCAVGDVVTLAWVPGDSRIV